MVQSLGYETYDARLRCLGQSPVTALTSADAPREVVSGLLRLPRLSRSRSAPCTNPCTNKFLTCGCRSSRCAHARTLACLIIPSPSTRPSGVQARYTGSRWSAPRTNDLRRYDVDRWLPPTALAKIISCISQAARSHLIRHYKLAVSPSMPGCASVMEG
jgi:hypothetical protein